jgi:nitroreductase
MSETPDARTTNDRITFLRTLRAVRAFRPDPVPQEVLDDILEVARWSGSASNSQPWEMIVVQNRDTLGALAPVDGYAGHLARAPLGIGNGSCSPPTRTGWARASVGSWAGAGTRPERCSAYPGTEW